MWGTGKYFKTLKSRGMTRHDQTSCAVHQCNSTKTMTCFRQVCVVKGKLYFVIDKFILLSVILYISKGNISICYI